MSLQLGNEAICRNLVCTTINGQPFTFGNTTHSMTITSVINNSTNSLLMNVQGANIPQNTQVQVYVNTSDNKSTATNFGSFSASQVNGTSSFNVSTTTSYTFTTGATYYVYVNELSQDGQSSFASKSFAAVSTSTQSITNPIVSGVYGDTGVTVKATFQNISQSATVNVYWAPQATPNSKTLMGTYLVSTLAQSTLVTFQNNVKNTSSVYIYLELVSNTSINATSSLYTPNASISTPTITLTQVQAYVGTKNIYVRGSVTGSGVNANSSLLIKVSTSNSEPTNPVATISTLDFTSSTTNRLTITSSSISSFSAGNLYVWVYAIVDGVSYYGYPSSYAGTIRNNISYATTITLAGSYSLSITNVDKAFVNSQSITISGTLSSPSPTPRYDLVAFVTTTNTQPTGTNYFVVPYDSLVQYNNLTTGIEVPFSGTSPFTAQGTYYVWLKDKTSNTFSASFPVSVTNQLTILSAFGYDSTFLMTINVTPTFVTYLTANSIPLFVRVKETQSVYENYHDISELTSGLKVIISGNTFSSTKDYTVEVSILYTGGGTTSASSYLSSLLSSLTFRGSPPAREYPPNPIPLSGTLELTTPDQSYGGLSLSLATPGESYSVRASTSADGYAPFRAFNKETTAWRSSTSASLPQSITLTKTTPIYPYYIVITGLSAAVQSHDPDVANKNGTNGITLNATYNSDSSIDLMQTALRIGKVNWNGDPTRNSYLITFLNPVTAYNQFNFIFNRCDDGSTNWVGVSEIRIFGAETIRNSSPILRFALDQALPTTVPYYINKLKTSITYVTGGATPGTNYTFSASQSDVSPTFLATDVLSFWQDENTFLGTCLMSDFLSTGITMAVNTTLYANTYYKPFITIHNQNQTTGYTSLAQFLASAKYIYSMSAFTTPAS